jgi:radical SAM family uncharacterized protein/radical SAM-linked protein
MSQNVLQEILPLVQKPSQYLGSEINTIKKDLSKVKLRFALVFPDLYEIGTSHFGLQILYHILNQREEIAAERVFAPGADMEAHLRSSQLPIVSLESQIPLREFDIIGFSLLYELNYTNILTIFDLSNIPFMASQRDTSFPLIIAGGPSTSNPEPVADFFDAMVIGDGEEVILEMSDIWLIWKEENSGDKLNLLRRWSHVEGVYVPAFFESRFNSAGYQIVVPKFSNYVQVNRTITGNLDHAPFPDAPVVPFGKPVHDRLRLEVSRGCTRGCRFCQAGMIYRPVRERSMDSLIDLSDKSLAATGYEDISLLSLSTGDYENIVPLLECLMAQCESNHIAVSLPSLRAGTLTSELMNLIKKVRKTGFTIAPEAGSQKLRDVINKNITEKDIVDTVNNAFNLGWPLIKLYFMIGLPMETSDDLCAIVDLIKDLRKLRSTKGRKGKMNVSLATFIPKPHTPFQWVAQVSLAESQEKLNWLKTHLKQPGVQLKWQNPEVSLLEGLWSRGDRKLSRLLIAAYEKGCRFDGWSDKFRFNAWREACEAVGVDIDFYTTRSRDLTEPLPWDHINPRVTKDFLKQEWSKALKRALTPDCRRGDCNSCGVCDFEKVEPKIHRNYTKDSTIPQNTAESSAQAFKRFQVFYSKSGQAKYFGHLEMVKIFLRAIKRAGLPVKYSEGFHPKPKVSFDDPLPIGLESQNELMYIKVSDNVKRQQIIKGLNQHLPQGLFIRDCIPANPRKAKGELRPNTYEVTSESGNFHQRDLTRFLQQPEFNIVLTTRKGKQKKIDLRAAVIRIGILSRCSLQMTLKRSYGETIRPMEILKHVFKFSNLQVKRARIVKLMNDNGCQPPTGYRPNPN